MSRGIYLESEFFSKRRINHNHNTFSDSSYFFRLYKQSKILLSTTLCRTVEKFVLIFYSMAGYKQYQQRAEKLTKSEQVDLLFDLVNAFVLVKDPYSSASFLQDLLTSSELKNLGKRLRIAKLLSERKTQEEIIHELHCSFATVAKVNYWLAEKGHGFKKIINKLPKRREKVRLKRGYYGYGLDQILIYFYLNLLAKSEREKYEKLLEDAEEKSQIFKDIEKQVNKSFYNST